MGAKVTVWGGEHWGNWGNWGNHVALGNVHIEGS